MTQLTLDSWDRCVVVALEQFAAQALGAEVETDPPSQGVGPTPLRGAFIRVSSDDNGVWFGLTGDDAAQERVVLALLGLEEDDGPLAEADVIDGLGEAVNVMAGAVKSEAHDADHELRLGLPGSTAEVAAHASWRARQIRVAGASLRLWVVADPPRLRQAG